MQQAFFKCKLDPTTYNKQDLISDLKYNYDLNHARRADDSKMEGFPATNFHIYYKDWGNTQYKKVNFSLLKQQYYDIIENFLVYSGVDLAVEYEWYIVNVNVSTNGYLARHDHVGSYKNGTLEHRFAMIHYISLKPHHSTTTFIDPVTLDELENFEMKEDDIFIFPSYIQHEVNSSKETTDDLRITVAVNIALSSRIDF